MISRFRDFEVSLCRHSFLCDGYFLHDAGDVWNDDVAFLSVFDKCLELAELIAKPMPTAIALIRNGLLAVQVKRKGVEDAHGAMHFDVTILALNAAVGEAVRVLRCAQDSQESGVVTE